MSLTTNVPLCKAIRDNRVTDELPVLDTPCSSSDTIHFEDEMQSSSKEDVNHEDSDDGFYEISLGSNHSEVGSGDAETFYLTRISSALRALSF